MAGYEEISGWYSIPLPLDKSIYGTYTVTVKLTCKIDPSQPVSILTRVVDPAGKDMSVKAADIMLE